MTSTTQAQNPWRLTAWVAGLFSLAVGLVMLGSHLVSPPIDPLKSPDLLALKEELRQKPTDEALKVRIRNLDLQLRQRYFRQLSRMQTGVYLLLGGVAVFTLAVTKATRKQPPMPKTQLDVAARNVSAARRARWSVAAVGAAGGAFLLVMNFGLTSPLPRHAAQLEKLFGAEPTVAAAPDAASPTDMRQNWPRFRGFEGSGVSLLTNIPQTWDTKSGAGVVWKVPNPAPGFNSPIVWGDRVFFSGGDARQREVFCLDTKTGQTLWRQPVVNVPGSPTQPPEIPDTTGYCAPSMATDGRRVYAIFANGDLAAFTFDGKQAWAKSFGALKNPYGAATSLTTWQDRLLVQLDQGESEENKSRLYAVDGRTGRVVWERPRKVGASWASPIAIDAAGKGQVITLAVPNVIAYATADGAELWRAECLNGEITPSPIFAGGLVLVPSPSEKLTAIRPDGQGDVAKTHVAWTNEDNIPDVSSPVSNGELVFTLTTPGLLSCLDIKDGKKQWEHDFEMECHASPSIAGNRLFVLGQKGVAVVVESARQFRELFRTEMGDAFHASPAFAQSGMLLRGVTNIWCIGPEQK